TASSCDTALSAGIMVNVQKNPPANITAGGPTSFCAGGSVVLTANAGAGLSYQWYRGANAIAGSTSITYTATIAGNYKCRVTKTATGCFKTSNNIPVTVPCKAGDDIYGNTDLIIYPNPNNGTFNLSLITSIEATSPFEGGKRGMISLEIYNSLGQLMYAKQLNSTDGILNETIELNDVSSGIYIVRIMNGESQIEQKLIIE
ncbi:MAG: T9SS type A sorting domain-containing protein, partial [Chitinophagales bacterium]|nr:T9SS type A sorting domain-containing protein [Chitinophagales bacterium]